MGHPVSKDGIWMKIWLRESRSFITWLYVKFRKHVETERKFEFLNSISYILRNIFKHLNKRFPRLIIVGRSVCNNIIVAKYDKIWLCSKVSQNFNSNPRLAKENIAGLLSAHPIVCWVSRLKRKAEVKSRTFSTHFWWPAAVMGSRSPWRRAMRYLPVQGHFISWLIQIIETCWTIDVLI